MDREHERLMPTAQAMFSEKLCPNTSLEVIFKNESGFGPAVTQSFYSEVAMALTNRKYGLFVEDDEPSGDFILGGRNGLILRPDLFLPEHVEQGVLSPSRSPEKPVSPKEKMQLLRFLGRVIGRSMREGYRLPIPLSESFFFLLQGDRVPAADWRSSKVLECLPGPKNDGWEGRVTGALYAYALDVARERESGGETCPILSFPGEMPYRCFGE